MRLNLVTVATNSYLALAPYFLHTLKKLDEDASITLLVEDSEIDFVLQYLQLSNCGEKVNVVGTGVTNGIPLDVASQGCAKKLRMWEYLASDIEWAIFLDIDTVPVRSYLEKALDRVREGHVLGLALDSYVGFKERLGEEFSVFKRTWHPHFDTRGRRQYVNTGFIISNREGGFFFAQVLDEWRRFYKLTGKGPSIWDQNIFNYCLDVSAFSRKWSDVHVFDENYNALKEYETYVDVDQAAITVNGLRAFLLHFNGGDIITKLARRARTAELDI